MKLIKIKPWLRGFGAKFLHDGYPSCRPTNSVKALKRKHLPEKKTQKMQNGYNNGKKLMNNVKKMHTFWAAISDYIYSTTFSWSFKWLLGSSTPPTKGHFRYPVAVLEAVQFEHSLISITTKKYLKLRMYQISAPAGPASGHFWQIRPNLSQFLATFPDLVNFSTSSVCVDYLQLMKLVLACHLLSDLMVWLITITMDWTNIIITTIFHMHLG